MTDVQFSQPEPTPEERREAVVASAKTTLKPPSGFVKLYDPIHERVMFGPDGQHSGLNIVIGEIEPHTAIVPVDHPQLAAFLKFHPHAIERDPSDDGKDRTWSCGDCDEEYPTKAALKRHQETKHKPKKA